MKAIICMFIPQDRLCPTLAYGEFYWSAKHKCHVWGGQTRKPVELSMENFNKVVDTLIHERDFFGKRTVRLLEEAPVAVMPSPAEPTAPVPTYFQMQRPEVPKRKRGVRKRSRRAKNKELI